MRKEEVHIDLIRDYFAGKLDAKTMHALEKRALEDSFLAEAMEGYEHHFANAENDLRDLTSRLNNRTATKRINLKPWLVAASLVLLLGLGTFFVLNNQHKNQQNITQEVVQNAAKDLPIKNSDTQQIAVRQIRKDSVQSSTKNIGTKRIIKTKTDQEIAISNADKKDNFDEVTVVAHPAVSDKRVTSIVQMNRREADALQDSTHSFNVAPQAYINSELQGRVAGVSINKENRVQNIRIIDSLTGQPIVGASIQAAGTHNFISDKQGFIHIPDSFSKATFTAIGYNSKSVALNNNVVMLTPAKDNLNDVVVTGLATNKRKRNETRFKKKNNYATDNARISNDSFNNSEIPVSTYPTTANIAPKIGWKKYKKYIHSQIKEKYVKGAKGIVLLRFSIDPNGAPVNIEIVKGLNDERNKQAMELIKNGSYWNTNSSSATVTYTIYF